MPESQPADIGGTLYQLIRLMRRYWHDGVISTLDMTAPQSIVIGGLKALGDGVNQTELSNFLAIHKAPLACIIDQLEQKGLVERRLDPQDRRVRRIFSTDRVREIHPRMEMVMDGLNTSLTQGISRDDLRTLDQCLETMRDNLLAGLGEYRITPAMDGEMF
ncbi:MAG TPA: MarR family winged helix-turn-helix transcriptional regulator [Alphaproteobacteria bacterium]|nr:MarR family winged helix-turn-helix transcriptional regulator [Alphaproteobacteria bacterium]